MTRLIEMVRYFGVSQDPLVRQQLADVIIRGASPATPTSGRSPRSTSASFPAPS